ncbi:MAG: hypothetical protein JST14_07235 [Bacteroidetes bacterium]|nr:hypothetical protein [Bacteroidota bacterium]MBS1978357.1 hypothetical protein [Bacteroidota bacterium]
MKKLFLALILLPSFPTIGQKIENWNASLQGDKIIISYDLVQGAPGEKYNVSIYGSFDNFASPLQKVTGDVGHGIMGGPGKKVIWDGKTELKGFKGELTFEIRAEVVSALSFRNAAPSAKRGKIMPVQWRGGSAKEVKVELIKDGVVTHLATTSNNGNYDWAVSAKQKTGSGYQLMITCGEESATSPPFAIKPKVPTMIKLIPLVAVAAVAGLAGGGGGSTGNNPPTNQNLPSPPDMGLN